MKFNNITTIAFDADDTLWNNESFFRESETKFCSLLSGYMEPDKIMSILSTTQIKNIPRLGYGVKSFTLSMLEALGTITKGNAPYELTKAVMQIGLDQLEMPVVLLPNVEGVLAELSKRHRLVVATKGELLEQHLKFQKTALHKYFDIIEVMYEKDEVNYSTLLKKLGCAADNFLMVGNSMKSDIVPVLNIGGHAVHIPYHTTWEHEVVKEEVEHSKLTTLDNISQLLDEALIIKY